jgi:hypothetical protein
MEQFSDMFENFMGKNMKNYLDLTLIETYKVLVSDTDPWPRTFEPKKKIKLIDQMIEYFTEREEYERCAKLVKVKEQVIKDVEDNK